MSDQAEMAAVGTPSSGSKRPGKMRADVAVWDLPHENAIVQPWGVSRVIATLRDGTVIARGVTAGV